MLLNETNILLRVCDNVAYDLNSVEEMDRVDDSWNSSEEVRHLAQGSLGRQTAGPGHGLQSQSSINLLFLFFMPCR